MGPIERAEREAERDRREQAAIDLLSGWLLWAEAFSVHALDAHHYIDRQLIDETLEFLTNPGGGSCRT